MLNIIAVSTSAAAAAADFYFDLVQEAQEKLDLAREWEARKAGIVEKLNQHNLHLKPFWYYFDGEEMLTITVTPENADELEAEIAEAEVREAAASLENRKLLVELEAHLDEHPADEDTLGFYSDLYKDEYGIRPRWKLAAWREKAHEKEV